MTNELTRMSAHIDALQRKSRTARIQRNIYFYTLITGMGAIAAIGIMWLVVNLAADLDQHFKTEALRKQEQVAIAR